MWGWDHNPKGLKYRYKPSFHASEKQSPHHVFPPKLRVGTFCQSQKSVHICKNDFCVETIFSCTIHPLPGHVDFRNLVLDLYCVFFNQPVNPSVLHTKTNVMYRCYAQISDTNFTGDKEPQVVSVFVDTDFFTYLHLGPYPFCVLGPSPVQSWLHLL